MNEIICPKCHEKFKVDDSGYAAILKQVENKEFNERLDKGILNAVKISEAENKSKFTSKLSEVEKNNEKKIFELTKTINQLQREIDSSQDTQKIAIKEAEIKSAKLISDQKIEIEKLKSKILNANEHKQLEIKQIQDADLYKIKQLEEELERVKQFKQGQSTKMVGESLEHFCEDEFNSLRAAAFSTDEFFKDNKAINGSKGDYIYKAKTADGFEYLSIMFEMKNEEENSHNKKRNSDHFAKLDKDRKNKNCEYAVLVSMLEQDSNLYNKGIVDMSGEYEKLYVIRPQFFITFITTLREFAKQSLDAKLELVKRQEMNIDITHFEENIEVFKQKFGAHYSAAAKKFDTAIKEIDKSIKALEQTKKFLIQSEDKLRLAEKDTEQLNVKKLTRGNPTMKEMFERLKKE